MVRLIVSRGEFTIYLAVFRAAPFSRGNASEMAANVPRSLYWLSIGEMMLYGEIYFRDRITYENDCQQIDSGFFGILNAETAAAPRQPPEGRSDARFDGR